MYQINLFYEQQEFQKQRDYDPVRITWVATVAILLFIGVAAGTLYMKMGDLRSGIKGKQGDLAKYKKDYDDMLAKEGGKPIDLGKIEAQAMSLHNRIDYRVLFATQLDILRDIIPANCRIKYLKTNRMLTVISERREGKDRDGNKITLTINKQVPSLEMIVGVSTKGKERVGILQIRDDLKYKFNHDPKLKEWLRQATDEDSTNPVNAVSLSSSNILEPLPGPEVAGVNDQLEGVFEYKLTYALKDPPREMQ